MKPSLCNKLCSLFITLVKYHSFVFVIERQISQCR